MPTASFPPIDEAKDVFKRLGYTVDDSQPGFIAERKWRRVQVTPLGTDIATDPTPPLVEQKQTRLQCFVTWKKAAEDLREYLLKEKPPYDWAVIGVDDSSSHDVLAGAPSPA